MPEISRFYGIVIRMYAEAGAVHHRAHLHAYYGEHEAVYLLNGQRLGGGLPGSRHRLVLAWMEIHREELLRNWHRLQRGEPPEPIDPLR